MDKPHLMDRLREAIRVRHYSWRTEEAYRQWVRRFILFHGKRHPESLGEPEVSAFLSHLAVDRNVAASTQNQALSAILFLYTHVLGRDLDWLEGVIRAKRPRRLPVVLSREEVQRVLRKMTGINGLLARLMYGTGMRAMESLQLRVKDVDFAYRQIIIREGKGNKDRVTPLPDALVVPLQTQLEHVRDLHNRDLTEGFGTVYLPHALARKYPQANRCYHGSSEVPWITPRRCPHEANDQVCGPRRPSGNDRDLGP